MDISVTACRTRGERRQGQTKVSGQVLMPAMKVNPFTKIMDHRKHEAKIYRIANGGVEQSFYRYYGILSE